MENGFTQEQIDQLRASMGMGSPASAGSPPPQSVQRPNPQQEYQQAPPQQSYPKPQAPQRPSAQEAMKARMQASRNQAASQGPVLMEQGETYNPVKSSPIDQTAPQPQQSAASNRTIINTTKGAGSGDAGDIQQNDVVDNDKKSGKGLKLNPVMAVGIAVVALLAVFFIFHGGNNSDEGDVSSDEDQVFDDPFDDPNIEWITPDTGSFYTIDQKAQLRAAGYTGDEIESYAAMMTPYSDLIREADAARDAYIQSAIAPLYDTASDEYKHFISQTWLTLPKRDDFPEWTNIAMNYTKRENLDYEKIDVYGNQLFIKIYLDDNEHKNWFFCSVTPDEWNRLGDAGNIIVNYVYTTHYIGDDIWTAVEDTENICIISSSIEFVN